MKLKLKNLPESLAAELTSFGHDVDTVRQEDLTGHSDPDVWAEGQEAGRFLVTQDLDFSDVRSFRPGTHHGLSLVRPPEAGRLALSQRIVEVYRAENVEAWQDCFVVLSGHKLRVLRPISG